MDLHRRRPTHRLVARKRRSPARSSAKRRAVPLRTPVHPGGSCRASGQGTVEFLLAAVPVLLLGLGSIEAIHWYFVRQAASLALVQAARAAVTQQADPAVLDQAFAKAMLPLHAGPSSAESQARLQRAIERRMQATALPAWRIRILSPSTATFHDFASSDPELPRHGSLQVLDNDYLHEQHQQRLAQGLAKGRGPLSGQTTLEANTLALRLTWLHEPLLPGVRNLLRQLAPSDTRYGSLAMARGGYLPIHREVALVMQSHAMAWAMPGHGRIVRLPGPEPASSGSPQADTASLPEAAGAALESPDIGLASCVGLWCPGSRSSGGLPQAPDHPGPGWAGTAQSPASQDTAPGTARPGAYLDPDAVAPEAPPWLAEPDDCPGCCA